MTEETGRSDCYLRKAQPEDIDLLFEWANDRETRLNSFNTQTITRSEHERWFASMMKDPYRIQYIMMHEDVPVGQIRLDITDQEAEISYTIAPLQRGKGFGCQIIALAMKQIKVDTPDVTRLRGQVKPHNSASMACFRRNGFTEDNGTYEITI